MLPPPAWQMAPQRLQAIAGPFWNPSASTQGSRRHQPRRIRRAASSSTGLARASCSSIGAERHCPTVLITDFRALPDLGGRKTRNAAGFTCATAATARPRPVVSRSEHLKSPKLKVVLAGKVYITPIRPLLSDLRAFPCKPRENAGTVSRPPGREGRRLGPTATKRRWMAGGLIVRRPLNRWVRHSKRPSVFALSIFTAFAPPRRRPWSY